VSVDSYSADEEPEPAKKKAVKFKMREGEAGGESDEY
jgi:hypothetical protein